jgi:hypothetical protein
VRIGSLGIPAAPKPACVDRRRFRFKLHGRVVRVEVFVNGVKKVVRKGRYVRSVSIKRLPRRRFVVKVVTTFESGRKRVSVRTYRGCTKSKPRTRRG